MVDFEQTDWFSDASLINEPYAYLEFLRSKGPVVFLPKHGVVAITGYAEGLPVFTDHDLYSAAVAVTGPIPPLPFKPQGDDISAQLEEHRKEMPMSGLIMTEDPPDHAKTKSLLMGMITPRRLAENEQFMWRLSNQLIDDFVERGAFESNRDYGRPYAALVIADLLGIPDADFPKIRSVRSNLPGNVGAPPATERDPLGNIAGPFAQYIQQRRAEPRDDVLGRLAQVTYRDGTTPSVVDVVKVATFLFGAGQHTTVLLLASALRVLAENQQLQASLRADRKKIPSFIEEVLRLQGPTKTEYRLAKRRTRIGDVDVPAGTVVVLLLAAMNRDPRRFERPNEFQLDRSNVLEHVAFGRGVHACAGAPLARAETRISLEQFLARMTNIRIDPEKHGTKGAAAFDYEPTFTMRGLRELHLDFTPA